MTRLAVFDMTPWFVFDMMPWSLTWRRYLCLTWRCGLWHDAVVSVWHDAVVSDMMPWSLTWRRGLWHDAVVSDMMPWSLTWRRGLWHDAVVSDMTLWSLTWCHGLCLTWRRGLFDMTPCSLTWRCGLCLTWRHGLWHDTVVNDMTPWSLTWRRYLCLTWRRGLWHDAVVSVWHDAVVSDMTPWSLTWRRGLCLTWRRGLCLTWRRGLWHDAVVSVWHDAVVSDMTPWSLTWCRGLLFDMTPWPLFDMLSLRGLCIWPDDVGCIRLCIIPWSVFQTPAVPVDGAVVWEVRAGLAVDRPRDLVRQLRRRHPGLRPPPGAWEEALLQRRPRPQQLGRYRVGFVLSLPTTRNTPSLPPPSPSTNITHHQELERKPFFSDDPDLNSLVGTVWGLFYYYPPPGAREEALLQWPKQLGMYRVGFVLLLPSTSDNPDLNSLVSTGWGLFYHYPPPGAHPHPPPPQHYPPPGALDEALLQRRPRLKQLGRYWVRFVLLFPTTRSSRGSPLVTTPT